MADPDHDRPLVTVTVGEATAQAIRRLMGVTGAPRLDSGLLLAHVIGSPREALIAHPEWTLTPDQVASFDRMIALRAQGMPIAYLLGSRPFYDRRFIVTTAVLIPRPETEKLVETALKWCASYQLRREPLRIIDVGTGSGVIGVTLAAKLPTVQVYATDVSASALSVARQNGNGLLNLRFIQADLLMPFQTRFDVIASNLPYIASAEMDILDVAKFEPLVALDGGADGLDLLRKLLSDTPRLIARPGLILLEHGADQGLAVAALARESFPTDLVEIIKDDAGLDRLVRIDLQSN